jgi:small basic protein
VPASGIISISLGVLLSAVSFIDIAERAAQPYFSVAVIACCVALVCFALQRLVSWPRVATLACAAFAVLVCILQIAS